jgi:hypothetical protein
MSYGLTSKGSGGINNNAYILFLIFILLYFGTQTSNTINKLIKNKYKKNTDG